MLVPRKSKDEKIDNFELPECSSAIVPRSYFISREIILSSIRGPDPGFVAPRRPPDPGFPAPFAPQI